VSVLARLPAPHLVAAAFCLGTGLAHLVLVTSALLPALALAAALGARIGFGTVANAVGIGLAIEALLAIDAVDRLGEGPLAARFVLLVGGIGLIGVGTAFYIGAALGAGPRDSLMLVVAQRLRMRIGAARTAIEVAALALGYLLGGTVGIGTLVFALGIGPTVELSFWLLERTPLAGPAVASAAA
jgi:uncharacterized membrane protein YczE